MADMESICARLCLLTRAAWKPGLPAPFMRSNVRRMIRLGALEGLTLRQVPDVKEEYYVRAEALLSRAAEIYDAVEVCKSQGYRVILPEDDEWPVRLRKMDVHMPQFLFVRGNYSLFIRRATAVSGSREVEENTLRIARSIGSEIARAGCALVSGGARGVDTAAQTACLQEGGNVIVVPAYPCSMLLRQDNLRAALESGHLLIACDAWPEEPFSAPKALARNHTIYALGDAAVAVAARKGRGGTWRGATDCLRGDYTPLYAVDRPDGNFSGNQALIHMGAHALDISRPVIRQLFDERM